MPIKLNKSDIRKFEEAVLGGATAKELIDRTGIGKTAVYNRLKGEKYIKIENKWYSIPSDKLVLKEDIIALISNIKKTKNSVVKEEFLKDLETVCKNRWVEVVYPRIFSFLKESIENLTPETSLAIKWALIGSIEHIGQRAIIEEQWLTRKKIISEIEGFDAVLIGFILRESKSWNQRVNKEHEQLYTDIDWFLCCCRNNQIDDIDLVEPLEEILIKNAELFFNYFTFVSNKLSKRVRYWLKKHLIERLENLKTAKNQEEVSNIKSVLECLREIPISV